MALDLRQNFVSVQYLQTNEQNFTKFYICKYIDKIYVGIVILHFFRELSGRVLDSTETDGPPVRASPAHCVVVLEQDTFILA